MLVYRGKNIGLKDKRMLMLMGKRLALILRGISFDENFVHVCMPRTRIVNYKYTLDTFNKYVREPLSKLFDVDVFFITYDTKLTAAVIADYQPKDYILIEDTAEWYRDNSITKYGGGTLLEYSSTTQRAILKKVEKYEREHDFTYDQVLITRFDLFFIRDITEYILDFDKFNFVCYGVGYHLNSTYDNFYLFNRKYLDAYYKCLDKMMEKVSSHYIYNVLNMEIGKENISFMFKGGIINQQHAKIMNKFYRIHPEEISSENAQYGAKLSSIDKKYADWLFDPTFTPPGPNHDLPNTENYFVVLRNNFAEYCNRMQFVITNSH
jgi:hypothetical protein